MVAFLHSQGQASEQKPGSSEASSRGGCCLKMKWLPTAHSALAKGRPHFILKVEGVAAGMPSLSGSPLQKKAGGGLAVSTN